MCECYNGKAHISRGVFRISTYGHESTRGGISLTAGEEQGLGAEPPARSRGRPLVRRSGAKLPEAGHFEISRTNFHAYGVPAPLPLINSAHGIILMLNCT